MERPGNQEVLAETRLALEQLLAAGAGNCPWLTYAEEVEDLRRQLAAAEAALGGEEEMTKPGKRKRLTPFDRKVLDARVSLALLETLRDLCVLQPDAPLKDVLSVLRGLSDTREHPAP